MTLFSKVSHLFSAIQNSPIETIELDNYFGRSFLNVEKNNIQLDIKRDDLLHPIISGNKWRKLKYLLLHIEQQGIAKVASMGGAYSNFMHVLAYVCHMLGWQCELHIRAFPQQPLTPTLQDCKKWGARLHFVDRQTFRAIREQPPELEKDVFWIPEGGMNSFAVTGLSEVLMELNQQYQYILIASATGTSVAGLINAANRYQPDAKIVGISVLKNIEQQRKDVTRLIKSSRSQWEILDGYDFGGFAKTDQNLMEFVSNFVNNQSIPLEPIYSGKSFYAATKLIQMQYFAKNSKVLLVHCGGLQGRR